MTEVEAAHSTLLDAQNAVSEARKECQRAERSLQLLLDAERNAWVALRDAQMRVDREGTPLSLPIPKRTRKKTYDLLADIEQQKKRAIRRERKEGAI